MSIQAGYWSWSGEPADVSFVNCLGQRARQFSPDGQTSYRDGSLAMLYGAFHVTDEDHFEQQPFVTQSGCALTWDGRLDNRNDLLAELGQTVEDEHRTDVSIVAAAYESWGPTAFRRMSGDWAVVVWDPRIHELILATDHVCARRLYYVMGQDHVVWCTNLGALVLTWPEPFTLDEEYIAGYLLLHPEPHLTPYKEIHAVPPGTSMRVDVSGVAQIERHWRFDRLRPIHHRSDLEYEEEFRHLFRQAVRRRLRSRYPLLAELSGGLDSSSVVCIAHDLVRKGECFNEINTISYHSADPADDDAEYIGVVEEFLGRKGIHIDSPGLSLVDVAEDCFSAYPGYTRGALRMEELCATVFERLRARTLLTGIGGDELLGGVPDPLPSLSEVLHELRFHKLARQLLAWAVWKKRPVIHLLGELLAGELPPVLSQFLPGGLPIPSWISPSFARRMRLRQRARGAASGVSAWLPAHIHERAVAPMAAFLMNTQHPPSVGCFARLHPCLDRELMSFLFAIPGEQILQPGVRRSLMRRALQGLVPIPVLNRTTKATAFVEPVRQLRRASSSTEEILRQSQLAAQGIIDAKGCRTELQRLGSGQSQSLSSCGKVVTLEPWLHDLVALGRIRPSTTDQDSANVGPRTFGKTASLTG